jgi:hypothetical protein
MSFQVDTTGLGHGGGISNLAAALLLPNVKTATFTSTDLVVINQVTGTVTGYSLDSGAVDFTIPDLFGAVAPWDPVAGAFLLANNWVNSEQAGSAGFGVQANYQTSGVATLGNLVAFIEYDGQVGCFVANTSGILTASYVTVGGFPLRIVALNLPDGTPVALVFDPMSVTLTKVDLSPCTSGGSPTILGEPLTLPFTKQASLPGGVGSWDIEVSSAGDVIALSIYDRLFVGTDPSTMAATYQITLTGIPNVIAANPDGTMNAGSWTFGSPQQETFVKVGSGGNITPMAATFDVPCEWAIVTPDGTQIYCVYNGAFQHTANE